MEIANFFMIVWYYKIIDKLLHEFSSNKYL